jgi:hypothetical protein
VVAFLEVHEEEEVACLAFVAVVDSQAYLVAFEEASYHLEEVPYPMVGEGLPCP